MLTPACVPVLKSGHRKKGLSLIIPPIRYCTDNAAMIGYAGILRMNAGEFSNLDLGPSPQALTTDFR